MLQRYCQSLEVSLADARQQLQEQNIELRSLKLEVEREKYHKDESRDLEKHLQQQNASVEEMTKVGSYRAMCLSSEIYKWLF